MKKPKILLYDIENTPNIIAAWGIREQDAVWTVRHWEILSFSYQWLGEGTVQFESRQGQVTDEKLVRKLHKLLSEADIVVAHNGIHFDNRKARARFLKYGLPVVKPFKVIDTLRVAQREFNMNSCSLNALADYLGIGKKTKHPGAPMWEGCMENDPKMWKLMERYNRHDIVLLRGVYKALMPYLRIGSDSILAGAGCPKPGCGGRKFIHHGYRVNAQGMYKRVQCRKCGGWAEERKGKPHTHKPLLRSA